MNIITLKMLVTMLDEKLPRPPRTIVKAILLVESSSSNLSAGADRLTWMKTQRTNRMKHWPMDDVILNKKLSRMVPIGYLFHIRNI